MRCDEIQPLIEPYLDGEVTEPASTRVAAHLASCSACAAVRTQFEHEQSFYVTHEVDLEVPDRFWSNVLETAAQQKSVQARRGAATRLNRLPFNFQGVRSLRFGPLAAAALVLLTIGITTGIMKYVSTSQSPPVPEILARGSKPNAAPTASQPADESQAVAAEEPRDPLPIVTPKISDPVVKRVRAAPRQQSPDDLVREAEQKYIAAIAILSRDANRRRVRLDADARAQFEQTLAVIDRAIASTRQAVKGSPGDPVAVQYMLAAYSKKVDVLRQMVDD
ncbi:MAG: zf-HC2 domain-containing protein [Acidobacteriota bacterium]